MSRIIAFAGLIFAVALAAHAEWKPAPPIDTPDPAQAEALRTRLAGVPHRIIWQTYRGGNWEIYVMNADGSNPENMTNTPEIDEYYPKASPDGRLIAFEVDTVRGDEARSEVWVMNADGSGRRKIADIATQPAWSPDGRTLAYMIQRSERDEGKYGLVAMEFHDMQSGEKRRHTNPEIKNLANLCYTTDGAWVLGVVGGAMGFSQSIVGVEAEGDGIVNLIHMSRDLPPNPETGEFVMGCRPDVSPDGKQVTWSVEEKNTRMWVGVADLVTSGGKPAATNWRSVATVPMKPEPWEVYHNDWSPDGKLIAFSKGPRGPLMKRARYVVREQAPGWEICVVDPENPGHYVELTSDGMSNKEPDWLPAAK